VWLRFSLRTLLLIVAAVAICLGIKLREARRQEAAVAAIRDLGGWSYYDYQIANDKLVPGAKSWVPEWLLAQIGKDFFHDVVEVNMVYNNDGPRIDNKLRYTDEVKDHLISFPRLRRLLLCNMQASDECLGVCRRLKRLEEILMWDASTVTDAGVAELRELPGLRYIHLSNAYITDGALQHFGTMRQLEGLSLQGNDFTDAGLSHLKKLTKLRSLWVDLGDTCITDAGLAHLHTLKSLQVLAVQKTEVTDGGIAELRAALPNLKRVVK
jgi:hypothetical protein